MDKNYFTREMLEVLDVDFPTGVPVTERTIAQAKGTCRTSMRMSTGRVWTTKDYETRRKRVLSTPLPDR